MFCLIYLWKKFKPLDRFLMKWQWIPNSTRHALSHASQTEQASLHWQALYLHGWAMANIYKLHPAKRTLLALVSGNVVGETKGMHIFLHDTYSESFGSLGACSYWGIVQFCLTALFNGQHLMLLPTHYYRMYCQGDRTGKNR